MLKTHRMSDKGDFNLLAESIPLQGLFEVKKFVGAGILTSPSTSATQADVSVYKAFQKEFPQFTRWFNHIASFTEEFDTLPAGKAPAAAAAAEEDDDEVDLFGSDDDEVDEEAEKLKQQRLAEYAAKKASKGPKPAAKSIVTLDVKPWDDETDLEELLANVKAIEMDGLTWGAHQWISRSCKSTWLSRMLRFPWMNCKPTLRKTRTTFNPPTLLLCKSCKRTLRYPVQIFYCIRN